MDAFDAMLRERLGRLVAEAPGHPGPRPVLPGQTATARGPGARRREAPRPMSVFAGIAVTSIVATIIGGTWLLAMPRTPAGDMLLPGASGVDADDRIVWDSGDVRLEADRVRIETPNGTFRAIDVTPIPDPDSFRASARWSPTPEESLDVRPGIEHVDFVARSDSGSRRYRTLKVTWQERGVEMRVSIYFAADETDWWATEVRVYDGSTEGDWIGWGGTYSTAWVDQRAWPSDDIDERLRAFGVPPDAEISAANADPEGITMVLYRDRRGKVHGIGCDGSRSVSLGSGERISWKKAPAELCPPPPVDLGMFRSRRGEAWTGDLELLDGVGTASGEGQVTGELHIIGMRLWAFE